MKVKNYNEAWEIAKALTSGCALDAESSKRAGYKVYRNETEYYTYVCDLGDRLEVNLSNGQTVNIWIENEDEENQPIIPNKKDIENVAKSQSTFEPEHAYIVRVFVMGYDFENDANRAVYQAMNNGDELWRNQIAMDVVTEYCNHKGIEWLTMRIMNITMYANKKNDENVGHYVIEAIVTIKE